MTAGRRGHAFHFGLRLNGTQLRRGERFRARRAVRLFATFVDRVLAEAGSRTLSSLLDALGVPGNVAEVLIALGVEHRSRGGDGLFNALSWLLLMINADINLAVRTSIHVGNADGVIFVSDDDE